jgi:hypothetical protein
VETENLVIGDKEFVGRRDRKGPEEGKFGRAVERDFKNSSPVVESITIQPGSSVDEKRMCGLFGWKLMIPKSDSVHKA